MLPSQMLASPMPRQTDFMAPRNISLPKVQDVRVEQSAGQRIFGIGNVSIETAGEASRLTMRNIDRPQTVADEVLAASHGATGPGHIT